MDQVQSIILFLLIGAAAGWLAGMIRKGRGFGVAGNLVIGIIGAIIGGVLFRLVGFQVASTLASLICATVGALVLLYLLSLVDQGGKRR